MAPLVDTGETKTEPDKPIEGDFEEQKETALAVPAPKEVALSTQDPAEFLERAVRQADALKKVIDAKNLATYIGNSRKAHVLIDGWQTLMALNGVMPYTVSVVQTRCTKGECHVVPECRGERLTVHVVTEIRRVADGTVLTRVETECSQHERRWSSADDYAVLSMAQTRGVGKGCRQLFGWVMALAGYDATPAEEMPDRDGRPQTGDADARAKTPMSEETVALLKKRIKQLSDEAKLASPMGQSARLRWDGFKKWLAASVGDGGYDALFADDAFTYGAKYHLGIEQAQEPKVAQTEKVKEAVAEAAKVIQGGAVLEPDADPLRELVGEHGVAPRIPPAAKSQWDADDQRLVRETHRAILGMKREGHERAQKVLTAFADFMNRNNLDWTGQGGRTSLWSRPDLRDELFAVLELDVPKRPDPNLPFDPEAVEG